jgi:hypothetical protein
MITRVVFQINFLIQRKLQKELYMILPNLKMFSRVLRVENLFKTNKFVVFDFKLNIIQLKLVRFRRTVNAL